MLMCSFQRETAVEEDFQNRAKVRSIYYSVLCCFIWRKVVFDVESCL